MPVRLYVGNLPEEVDRQALEKLFRSAGEVISTKVIRDRKTGKCRGFGFVTVNTEEQAQQYIEKFNGHSFGDVNLRIELAQPRDRGEEGESKTATSEPSSKESRGSKDSRPSRDSEAKGPKESAENPAPSKKQRQRGNKGGRSTVVAESEAASEPDPRWASQLQRIKEQLLQVTNS
ncbi:MULTISPECIES: RNA recognition motif domain-containing protein [unclassified Synechococcus]|jgi:RNA recognition motif-containing protein|uniref:RNA recognition motif domain-containing protein n=1 Tax=unclassified Synechococcus TaxID=2626047 RepID=UPI0039C3F959